LAKFLNVAKMATTVSEREKGVGEANQSRAKSYATRVSPTHNNLYFIAKFILQCHYFSIFTLPSKYKIYFNISN